MNLEELKLAVLEQLDEDFKSGLEIVKLDVSGENDDLIAAYKLWFTKDGSHSLSAFAFVSPQEMTLETLSETLVDHMHFAYKTYLTRRDIV